MPEVLKDLSNIHQEKLCEAVAELIETERTYVSRLMTTYKIYVVEGQSFLNENDRDQIFSNLDEVLIANDNFFTDLTANCVLERGKGIGETFIKHIPNFSVYLVYCKNQTSSIKYLQKKMNDQAFANFIKDSLSRPECGGLDLASFLLEPVQRLTRYPMMLKQILKYTPSPSEECNLLAIAIEESENLLERVNKSMLEGEEFEQLVQLQRRLSSHGKFSHSNSFTDGYGGLPENLAGLTRNFGERKLLKKGLWIKLRSRRKLLVFLFSDFLLLTEASSGETSLSMLDDDEAKLKVYRKAVHLDDIWLMREAESSKVPNNYQNSQDLRAFELEAHDFQPLFVHVPADEFDDWIDAISIAKRRLKTNPPSQNSSQSSSAILGSLRLTLNCASSLPSGDQFYTVISSNDSDQTFSTNPSRGPIPVWNQTFSMPVRSSKYEIKIELFKYDQYKINESYGEFKVPFELTQNEVSESRSILSNDGIELKMAFIFDFRYLSTLEAKGFILQSM